MNQVSEELIRAILQYLWQQHLQAEQQYLYWILLAPIIGLMFFIVMWYRHKAHVYSLLDAISFFFVPRGPDRMLVFKDPLGNRLLLYDYRVVKGQNGYLIQAGPYLIKSNSDPDEYSEPVSLVDARGPPGIPSPFGLFVRQLVSVYFMIAMIAVSFVNTFYTTWDPYMKYSQYISATWTAIDLLAFAALVISIAWLIAILIRALSPQTMISVLSAVGVSEKSVEASPGLDAFSSFPPGKLLKSINREPKVVVSDKVEDAVKEIEEEVGDRGLAASLLALLGQVYDTWRKSLGILLKDQYDISVASRARYQLSTEKIPRGFLSRNAGLLALIAIIGMIVLAVLWLQPSIAPAATNTTTTTGVITPAPPPPPPTTTTPTVSPPAPPPPG